ncbi:MAG: transcriptional repressor [Candidatus Thiodiazotropha sp. (ex Monitilora ramsayi)]|nr:transcriptional repressor [Candidatus Thiodiazotropha sp. (ex Monitilora ramsayi)]
MTDLTHNEALQKTTVDQRLTERGIFVTAQRRAIADVLFARNQHLTADQLLMLVNETGAKVSKATIYNTLGLFAEKGLVREIHISSAKTFYDSNTSRHHHFYNMDTGDLIDMKERLAPLFLQSDLPDGTVMETADIVVRVRNQKP